MAINSLVFEVDASTIQFIPTADSRPQMVYVDGKRTEAQRANEAGQPLESLTAVATFLGQQGDVRISLPQHIDTKALPFGSVLRGAGKAVITARAASGDNAFGLAVSIVIDGIASQGK